MLGDEAPGVGDGIGDGLLASVDLGLGRLPTAPQIVEGVFVRGADRFLDLAELTAHRGGLARDAAAQFARRGAVDVDGVPDDLRERAGMQRFERVELDGALAVSLLECGLAAVAGLDRHSREVVFLHLIPCEGDRDQSDVEVIAIAAKEELDLARDRNRHAIAGRIVIGNVENAGATAVLAGSACQGITAVTRNSPRPVTSVMPSL